jgi:hypothetical protein
VLSSIIKCGCHRLSEGEAQFHELARAGTCSKLSLPIGGGSSDICEFCRKLPGRTCDILGCDGLYRAHE